METKPLLLCLNETFLDTSVGEVKIEGYEVKGRRDRPGAVPGKQAFGGVAIYVREDFPDVVSLIETSNSAERLWVIIHAETGPILLSSWYWPPQPGETETIALMKKEYLEQKTNAIGSIIVGHMNVHNPRWLRNSSRQSVEGNKLQGFCHDSGFRQYVRKPIRESYLLDLVLSDLQVKCKVLDAIREHKMVLTSSETRVLKNTVHKRKYGITKVPTGKVLTTRSQKQIGPKWRVWMEIK